MKLLKRIVFSSCLGAFVALGVAVGLKNRTRILAASKEPIFRSGAGLKWKVVDGPVASDPLHEFAPPFEGKLCYSFDTLQGPMKSFLVLREGSKTTTLDLSGNQDLSPRVPIFSPDGQSITLLMGDSEGLDHPNDALHVLNLQTGSIRLVSQRTIEFENVEWSRDGRYLAFVEGGNVEGKPVFLDEIADHPSLWICDVRSGREWCAAKNNDGVNGGFKWGENDDLFFSVQTKNQGSSILKMKPGGGATPVLSEARSPLPSLSGSQIAFVRWTNEFVKPIPLALCVAQSNGTKRRVLRREDARTLPVFAWSRDEKRLFRVGCDATSRRGEVVSFNVQSGKSQRIGQFQSAAYQGFAPSFANLHAEKTGALVCGVNSLFGVQDQDHYHYSTSQTLQSLDAKGQLRVWATSTGGSTLAWHSSDAG